MESQDTGELYLLKLWTVFENKKKQITWVAIGLAVLVLLVLLYNYEQDQKEINAGQAYSQMLVGIPQNESSAQLADQYLKVAGEYSGTSAGQRALLQGAADLFAAGSYADAQAQFQKFADASPDSPLIATAELGIAASQEAQGKMDAALDGYKKIIESYNDISAQISAKFGLARIYEQKGKPTDAIRYYEEVARSVSGSTLGQQAMLKEVELKAAMPAPPAAPAPAATMTAPLTLTPPSK